MTFAAWRTLVKLAYQGGEPTEAALMRAVADGARMVTVRDVESDLALARSYENSFRVAKVKMAGTRIAADLPTVTATVRGLMPIDADTEAINAILDNAIAGAYDEVQAMADKWDAFLLQCCIALQTHVPFYQVRQITNFVEGDGTTTGFVTKVPLPETARIQQLTYGHFYAPLEADTVYEADDKVISNGRVYKVVVGGSLTVYEVAEGLTSTTGDDETLGDMTFSYFEPERDWPVRQFEWSARNRLAAGEFSGGPAYCFPPQSDEIWLYPKLDADHRFDLEWVGVAETFEDADEVLFDRTAAEAAAHFLKSMFAQTELDDIKAAGSSYTLYQLAIRKAVVANQDRDTGSPTQVQPYDYRRRCCLWGSCCPPITVNPGSGGMEINAEISLTNASGTTIVRPWARNFTVSLEFTGGATERIVVLGVSGQNGYIQNGTRLSLVCTLPAVEGMTLKVKNRTAAGDDLLAADRFPDNQLYTDGLGTTATLQFYYDGLNWRYEEASVPA